MENNIAIAHYYCRPSMSGLCGEICSQLGIELQCITDVYDITVISQNARNLLHVDCLIIDLGMFAENTPEQIRDAVYTIIYVRGDIPVILVDTAHDSNDETVGCYRSYGFDKIYTKDFSIDVLKSFLSGDAQPASGYSYEEDIAEDNTSTVIPDNTEPQQEPFEEMVSKQAVQKPKSAGNSRPVISERKDTNNSEKWYPPIQQPIYPEDSVSVPDKKEKKRFGLFGNKKSQIQPINMPMDKQITMVAVGGTEKHIGSTHHAIAFVKYLNGIGISACYINADHKDIIADTKKYIISDVYADHIECCGIPMFYSGTGLMQIIAHKYKYYVFDYGSIGSVSEQDFYSKDIKIIVAGTKPWEMERLNAICEQTQLYGIELIANYADDNMRTYLQSMYKSRSIHFAAYCPNPFVDKTNDAVYKQIIMGGK